MPTPFPFVSGAVLTAANLNSITELPTRTLTTSGAAVAADAYSRVILNGSTITYTVNSATFTAGQVVQIYNANSTTATIAAGTGGVTINSAAGLTIQQWQGATLYAVSSTSFVLFDTAITSTTPGLELVKTQTIGNAVSSVNVTDAFSSSYENYKIIVSSGVASTGNSMILTLGATASGYSRFAIFGTYNATTVSGANTNNGTGWADVVYGTTNTLNGEFDLYSPNLAKNTHLHSRVSASGAGLAGIYVTQGGYLADTTQYTAFTLTTNSGTVTGGTIRVYGYKN